MMCPRQVPDPFSSCFSYENQSLMLRNGSNKCNTTSTLLLTKQHLVYPCEKEKGISGIKTKNYTFVNHNAGNTDAINETSY
jgi:hypothetical protein